MIEKHLDIPTADGRMDSFVVHPERAVVPPVVRADGHLGAARGTFDIARRVAARLSRPPAEHLVPPRQVAFEYRDEKGRMRSLLSLPRMKVQDELPPICSGHRPHGDGRHRRGAEIPRRRAGAERTKGTIGYCLGGRLSLAAAAEFPISSAPAHLTRHPNGQRQPNSPHRFVDNMRGGSTAALPRRTILRRPPPSRRWQPVRRLHSSEIPRHRPPGQCTATRCRTATSSRKPPPTDWETFSQCSKGS